MESLPALPGRVVSNRAPSRSKDLEGASLRCLRTELLQEDEGLHLLSLTKRKRAVVESLRQASYVDLSSIRPCCMPLILDQGRNMLRTAVEQFERHRRGRLNVVPNGD